MKLNTTSPIFIIIENKHKCVGRNTNGYFKALYNFEGNLYNIEPLDENIVIRYFSKLKFYL